MALAPITIGSVTLDPVVVLLALACLAVLALIALAITLIVHMKGRRRDTAAQATELAELKGRLQSFAEISVARQGDVARAVNERLDRMTHRVGSDLNETSRKTHESIGKALPGRRNLVVTRGAGQFAGCEVVGSLDAALQSVSEDPLPFIIGGAQLYAEALPKVTHLFLTQLDRYVEADAFFPPLDESQWREVKRESGTTPGVTFVDLLRREG